MEQIMENEDIKRVIYSFGYPEHRFYMKDLSTRLNTNLEPIKEISDAWEYDQGEIGNSMSYYIQCRFTKDQMIQMYHKNATMLLLHAPRTLQTRLVTRRTQQQQLT